MPNHIRIWGVVSVCLGASLALLGRLLAASTKLPSHERPGLTIATAEGVALLLVAVLAWLLARARHRMQWLDEDQAVRREEPRAESHPYVTLFVVSFVALFIELMLIRYCNSQIRIFSFFKNVPLIGAYLGLGLGCWLRGGKPHHVLVLLLWLVPVAVFLSAGSVLTSTVLGRLAAIGSSELILGDYIPTVRDRGSELLSQAAIAAFCTATLVVVTLLFTLLGRLLGDAFDRAPRLPAYTINILGSLAGVLGFVGLSLLETPPAVWFCVGLLPLLWWLPRLSQVIVAVTLVAVSALAVTPSSGETIWSRYQKLVGHAIPAGPQLPAGSYLVDISDVFYQIAVDRRHETLARAGVPDPFPHYGAVYAGSPPPESVLIVGAGTGNDVAAALHAGAGHVDAVDIDPAIVRMGRRHHPERPYDDPRVRVLVDDARHAFRTLSAESYDVVVFGLLDSHTQLGISSVRLDNYVFTVESFTAARRLIRPGGRLVVTAATFQPWFERRFVEMLRTATGQSPKVSRVGAWVTYQAEVQTDAGTAAPIATHSDASPPHASLTLPSDDWPFLYLPARGVPGAYLFVIATMAVASVIVLRLSGLPLARFTPYYAHLFFLGAAFLLMEVHAINRLALLFGTTWLVSAVTIVLVLLLIVAANLTLLTFPGVPYVVSFAGLAASLALSFHVEPSAALGGGEFAAFGMGLALLSPIYFAGLVFARSFRGATIAGPAIGANILGSVLGGWVEYCTMALGMRALVLLAAGLYLLSVLALVKASRAPSGATEA